MSLSTGTRFGPYEILSLLGAGGMGEVYKARDTRLDRDVAIKVLTPRAADDLQSRARFQREARAIAALNHPHICTLHDIGNEHGTDFLVMECLEGETLADCVKRGPVGLDQALKMATEIGDALDKAHRAGIVHRDLKPSNVMITRGGVKLLDFGLARFRAAPHTGGATAAITQSLSGEGMLTGTVPYMAPEQLEAAAGAGDYCVWRGITMLTGRRGREPRERHRGHHGRSRHATLQPRPSRSTASSARVSQDRTIAGRRARSCARLRRVAEGRRRGRRVPIERRARKNWERQRSAGNSFCSCLNVLLGVSHIGSVRLAVSAAVAAVWRRSCPAPCHLTDGARVVFASAGRAAMRHSGCAL